MESYHTVYVADFQHGLKQTFIIYSITKHIDGMTSKSQRGRIWGSRQDNI